MTDSTRTADQRLADREERLRRANINLYVAAQRMRDAYAKLHETEREHSAAVDEIERIEAERD